MSVRTPVANVLWAAASIPARRRFRGALRAPQLVQETLVFDYLSTNQNTAIGRELGFAKLLSRAPRPGTGELAARYQAHVPVMSYDSVEHWIRKIRDGHTGILTDDPVVRLTPSSGSTSAAKLLPFTASLQREFSRAVDAWMADLFVRCPTLLGGPAYWSITPALSVDCAAAVPVGFAGDSEYLGGVRGAFARAVLAVPDEVSRIRDADAFRYVTLLFLVRARRLRLISIWHPSFFTRLFEALPDLLDRIADDIGRGTLSPPGELPTSVRAALASRLRADQGRARELRRLSTLQPHTVWPALALVSCWQDGASNSHAMELARAIAPIWLQPKGLVATEGIVSIPFDGRHPLAVRSHFFEFLDDHGIARLAHQLEMGCEYSVVLTTGGGLYRYRLGDRVVVDGWVENTPSVRFVGRDDRISDRFGEKLSDGFVARVLRTTFEKTGPPRFAMLAPERDPDGVRYTLFVESDRVVPELAATLERELRRNPHYAWCVDLRQLNPARVALVGPNADRVYVDTCVARGQRLGDVKPVALDCDTGWRAVFERLGPCAVKTAATYPGAGRDAPPVNTLAESTKQSGLPNGSAM